MNEMKWNEMEWNGMNEWRRGAGGYEQIPLEEPSAPHTENCRDEAHLRQSDPRDLVGDDRERILNPTLISWNVLTINPFP